MKKGCRLGIPFLLILRPDIVDLRDMRVVVNLRNSADEKVLLAFLDSLEYEYQTQPDAAGLPAEQQDVFYEARPIAEGETIARTLEEIKKDLLTLLD